MRDKLILLLILTVSLGFITYSYENKVFSPHFVDEEDNFVLGKYLLNGEKIYGNLFSHHQPLGYIFSAGIQKVTNPNSLFLLVKRHREAVMLWSILWSLLLVIKFGAPMLLTVIAYELTKIYMFGNLFLAEGLVVYPLLYISSFALSLESKKILEYIFLGICIGFIVFLLSPAWPLVLTLTLLIFYKQFNSRKMVYTAVGFSLIILLILPFISVADYINQAYIINFKYYIPQASHESWMQTFIKALFSPLSALFTSLSDSQILPIIQLFSVTFLINLVLLVKRKAWKLLITSTLILGISNIRYVKPGMQYYSGFHILPWFVLLIFFTFYLGFSNWNNFKNVKIKLILTGCICAILFACIYLASQSLFKIRDFGKDFYINYSRQFDFGVAVNILKSKNESLFVVPDEWLIYWQADVKHSTKMLNYYAWMTQVPQLKSIVEDNFKHNPPTYLYCNCEGSYFGLEKYWNLYLPIKKHDEETQLFVLKEKINTITDEQKKALKFYEFTF